MRDWLIAIRKQKGIKQFAIAKEAGVSQPTYCNIELGKRQPTPKLAKRIASILDFDWTRFYEDENDCKPA